MPNSSFTPRSTPHEWAQRVACPFLVILKANLKLWRIHHYRICEKLRNFYYLHGFKLQAVALIWEGAYSMVILCEPSLHKWAQRMLGQHFFSSVGERSNKLTFALFTRTWISFAWSMEYMRVTWQIYARAVMQFAGASNALLMLVPSVSFLADIVCLRRRVYFLVKFCQNAI